METTDTSIERFLQPRPRRRASTRWWATWSLRVGSSRLDGIYAPDRDGKGLMFHPAPAPTQEEIEQLALRVSRRILRFLQRRGVITLVTAPGDGEVTVVPDETLGEQDPLLAKLLAAATAGMLPAGPATKRQPVRIVLHPDDRPVGKGSLCAQAHGFNLQAATRVAANDKPGRERLCRYILRPPTQLTIPVPRTVPLAISWRLSTTRIERSSGHTVDDRGSVFVDLDTHDKRPNEQSPACVPELHPARPPPPAAWEAGDAEDWVSRKTG